jgi:hypothetical protein
MNDANRQVGTRPLAAVVPDYESLLADPAGYLNRGELRIGARRVPWWMFLLAPAFFGLGMYLIPARIGYAFAISSPILLGALIYWAWPVHRELVLRADDVEFVRRDDVVRCPWPLFDAILGRPSTDQAESFSEREPQTTAITVVAPDAVIQPGTALSLSLGPASWPNSARKSPRCSCAPLPDVPPQGRCLADCVGCARSRPWLRAVGLPRLDCFCGLECQSWPGALFRGGDPRSFLFAHQAKPVSGTVQRIGADRFLAFSCWRSGGKDVAVVRNGGWHDFGEARRGH